ncbi:MAG: LAGLIDADG family homing endonuclease [Candidatus Brockarchaeota archaeon]|nr:LAGLIDADG family homing endonuclease [Candidatus Brockarchaeota archaeon]
MFFDLWDLGIKGPGHYEFHPPLEHLDEESKRAYVRGFFSGDGMASVSGNQGRIRIDSVCKEGLEELRKILISLGFHPYEIYEQKPRGLSKRTEYRFHIPAEEHLKFIEEIGSEREEHKNKFELIRRIYEEKSRRKETK